MQPRQGAIVTFPNDLFDRGQVDAARLGYKAARLADMAALGLPVPPGFTIPADICTHYHQHHHEFPKEIIRQVPLALDELARQTGRRFGDSANPLLLAVRSGTRNAMPGMADTLLNLGLNDQSVESIASATGDARFAYDSYRRFIQIYAHVVMGLDHHLLEDHLEIYKEAGGHALDAALTATDLRQIVTDYKSLIEAELSKPFPQDPLQQLWAAIEAAIQSWMAPRAVTYRAMYNIPENWGIAVTVQAMVFGNRGSSSATGVAFTRNPNTGEAALSGRFLMNAQGDELAAGIRTPQELTEVDRHANHSQAASLETLMPQAFAELTDLCKGLEAHYKDVQAVTFTIERGKLWLLQSETSTYNIKAALKIAVDMEQEGLISKAEALQRIDPGGLDQLLHQTLDPAAEQALLTVGLPASPGAACGEVVFTSLAAQETLSRGRNAILVRLETGPDDVGGMHAAQGIITARGGMTSHAAVVTRGMGKPCVSGASQIRINAAEETLSIGAAVLTSGDIITIDGSTGKVLAGAVALRQPELSADFETVLSWADNVRQLSIRANVETSEDANTALAFGASGIGLCRTEHMFLEPRRIAIMREMILADKSETRSEALTKLLPIQQQDFTDLFLVMRGKPVTLRLLDPPLHEFLPRDAQALQDLANALNMSDEQIKTRIKTLYEFNPMLGHRGCRLAVSYPDIAIMQTTAIVKAAINAARETNAPVELEIMVPLVMDKRELAFVKELIDTTAQDIMAKENHQITYSVGTMIELPRAALLADDIATEAAFFSFGTNDLTQTVFGISRDDASEFLNAYIAQDLLDGDPFVSLDQQGVGALVSLASEKGRRTRPDIKLGICGEHAGDPASIDFCQSLGLDYVSCSPFRVPIARLAAAQAVLKQQPM